MSNGKRIIDSVKKRTTVKEKKNAVEKNMQYSNGSWGDSHR